jgi:thiol-disulfide isomerase/thioredoxin
MNRWIRPLVTTALAAAATFAAPWALALTIAPYSAPALAAAQQAGQPVAVHFHADWCPTCKQQEKALAQLKTEPGLDITVLVADYDVEKDLRKTMKVRMQSTMVVFKGAQEKARLAGDTAPDKIRMALKAGL